MVWFIVRFFFEFSRLLLSVVDYKPLNIRWSRPLRYDLFNEIVSFSYENSSKIKRSKSDLARSGLKEFTREEKNIIFF